MLFIPCFETIRHLPEDRTVTEVKFVRAGRPVLDAFGDIGMERLVQFRLCVFRYDVFGYSEEAIFDGYRIDLDGVLYLPEILFESINVFFPNAKHWTREETTKDLVTWREVIEWMDLHKVDEVIQSIDGKCHFVGPHHIIPEESMLTPA